MFFLSVGFWECFTPFNQSGELWPLIGLELGCWVMTATREAIAIAWGMDQWIT